MGYALLGGEGEVSSDDDLQIVLAGRTHTSPQFRPRPQNRALHEDPPTDHVLRADNCELLDGRRLRRHAGLDAREHSRYLLTRARSVRPLRLMPRCHCLLDGSPHLGWHRGVASVPAVSSRTVPCTTRSYTSSSADDF